MNEVRKIEKILNSIVAGRFFRWTFHKKMSRGSVSVLGGAPGPQQNEIMSLLHKLGPIHCYIYCSGKAGSMTLQRTLEQHFSCLHVHNNTHFQVEIARSELITVFDCIRQSLIHYPEVYLIDSYRLPVERVVSSFFQNLGNHLTGEELELGESQLFPLMSDRLDQKIRMENYHSINEVMRHFDAPLFSAFDFSSGYNLHKKGNLVFIKLRFADIDRWGTILSEIFDRQITIESSNLSSEKPYSGLYSRFKDYYRVPAKAFAEMTNSREFRIYTTEEEKAAYLAKWKGRLKD